MGEINDGSVLFQNIISGLNHSDIPYCFLRNFENYPQEWERDIDILTLSRSIDRFLSLIKEIVTDCGASPVFECAIGGQVKLHIYCPFGPVERRHLCFDIHVYFSDRGCIYLSGQSILSRLTSQGGINVPSPGALGASLLLRGVFEKGHIDDDKMALIRYGYESEPASFKGVLRESIGACYVDGISILLSDGREGHILEERSKFLLQNFRKFPANSLRRVSYFLSLNMSRLKRAFLPKGLFVVLLGPDGSGKTTISNQVLESLERAPFVNKYIYLGSRSQTLPEKYKKIISTPRSSPLNGKRSPFVDFLSLSYHCCRYFLTYLKCVYPVKVGRGIILGDRYYYDMLIGGYYNFPSIVKRMAIYFMPNPDIVFLLVNDPEVVRERKKERTIVEIVKQLEDFKELGEYLPHFIEVCTRGSIDRTSITVLDKIMEAKRVL